MNWNAHNKPKYYSISLTIMASSSAASNAETPSIDIINRLNDQLTNENTIVATYTLNESRTTGQLLHLIRQGLTHGLIIRIYCDWKLWDIRAVKKNEFSEEAADEILRYQRRMPFTDEHFYEAKVDLGNTQSIRDANKRYKNSEVYRERQQARS